MEGERSTADNHLDEDAPVDIRRYIRVLLERKWWFIGTVFLCLLLAAVHIAWKTPIYEAQATLLVDTGSRYSYGRQQDVLETIGGVGRLRTLDTQIQIVRARSRLEGAARLVAARQLVSAAYASDTTAVGGPSAAEPPGNPGTTPRFLAIPAEAESSIVAVLRSLKGAGLPADWAVALLIGDAQPEQVRSDSYPPVNHVQPEQVRSDAHSPPDSGSEGLGKAVDSYFRADERERLATLASRWVPLLARSCRAQASVHGIGETDVLAIACRSTIPELSAAYANALTQEHLWRSLISNQEAARRGVEWVDGQAQEARGELEGQQGALADLLRESGLGSVPEAATSLTARVASLSDGATNLRAAVSADNAEVARLSQQLSEQENAVVTTTTTATSPTVGELRKKLVDLETERAALLDKVTEAHPGVAETDAQTEWVKQQIEKEVADAVYSETRVQNPLGQRLLEQLTESQVRLVADEARLAATEAALGQAQAELSRVPDVEQRAAQLQREVELAEKSYLALLERKRQLKLAEVSEVAGAEILDYARVPPGHVSPNRRLTMIMALLMGLIVGSALALLVDHLDNTVKDPAELERLYGVPVLAIVPRIRGNDSTDPLKLSLSGEQRLVSEAYRSLRSNLRFSMPDLEMKCLLLTSPGVGEGKTTTCLNLSLAFGELGDQVVLVDTDLRRPRIAQGLGLANEVGLTTCAIGDQPLSSALRETPYDNVRALTSGPIPPNPPRVLESDGMKRVLGELRQAADFIILDSPPAALLSDAQALASLADGVVLVVEFGKTRRPLVERALELLNRTGTPCLGIVMNKVVATRDGYGYYYYYYGGYYRYEEGLEGEQQDAPKP